MQNKSALVDNKRNSIYCFQIKGQHIDIKTTNESFGFYNPFFSSKKNIPSSRKIQPILGKLIESKVGSLTRLHSADENENSREMMNHKLKIEKKKLVLEQVMVCQHNY